MSQNQITNRILKTELVEWRKLKWLQNPDFKQLSPANYNKLKESLLKNNFLRPFNIWQDKKTGWILDGHHLQLIMEAIEKEGGKIPDLLPANFLECKDIQEARKLVIVYSAVYAEITERGLTSFLSESTFDFAALSKEVNIPNIDLNKYTLGGSSPAELKYKEDEIKPYNKFHILLSFSPELLIKIQPYLEKIQKVEGIEYETTAN